jgi:hypothetical protein
MIKKISHQDTKTRRKEELLRFSREDTRRYTKKQKKIKIICVNLCNLWTLIRVNSCNSWAKKQQG